MDNTLRDLYNSSYPTKTEFNIRSKPECFLTLRSSYSLRVLLVHDGKVRARGAFAQVLVPSLNGREEQDALRTSLDKTRLYKAKKETLLY